MTNKGTYNFEKDLEAIGKKMGVKTIKQEQKKALKPLLSEIKQDTPVRTGELKKGEKIKAGPRRKGWITTVVEIKTSEENAHAGRSEFGTRNKPAQPFIRPAVSKLKEQIINSMVDGLDEALRSVTK